MQITTLQAVQYALSRNQMRKCGRAFPFPTGYALRKLDEQLRPSLVAYDASLAEIREAVPDEAAFHAALQPILDTPLTVEFTALAVEAFGTVPLTDDELQGLAPFISN